MLACQEGGEVEGSLSPIEDIVGHVERIPAQACYKSQLLRGVEGVLKVKAGSGPTQGVLLLLALREAAHRSFEEVKLCVAELGWLLGTASAVVPIVRSLSLGSIRSIGAVVGIEAELAIA